MNEKEQPNNNGSLEEEPMGDQFELPTKDSLPYEPDHEIEDDNYGEEPFDDLKEITDHPIEKNEKSLTEKVDILWNQLKPLIDRNEEIPPNEYEKALDFRDNLIKLSELDSIEATKKLLEIGVESSKIASIFTGNFHASEITSFLVQSIWHNYYLFCKHEKKDNMLEEYKRNLNILYKIKENIESIQQKTSKKEISAIVLGKTSQMSLSFLEDEFKHICRILNDCDPDYKKIGGINDDFK